jgi:hypothetical protein
MGTLDTTRFKASIHEGKFVYEHPELLRQKIIKLEGQEVWVSLVKKTKGRSDNQNRYYWGVVIKILGEHLGYFDYEIHDGLKSMFLLEPALFPKVRSTTDLSTKEMEDYLAKIRTWSSTNLNVFIPEPNEVPYDY